MKLASLVLTAALLAQGGGRRAAAEQKPPAAAEDKATDQARQHFQRGVKAYNDGSLDAALAEFRKAYDLRPDYRVLFNIAQVQAERHDYAAALALYIEYLEMGGPNVGAERVELVQEEIRRIYDRVAEIAVTANIAGAELVVDNVVVGTLPLTTPAVVNAGVRNVVVRKAGYSSSSRSVTLVAGETQRLAFQLEETPQNAAPNVARASAPGNADGRDDRAAGSSARNRTPLWLSLAATGLLAGGTVTAALLTRQANRALDDDLGSYPASAQEIRDDRSRLKLWAGVTDGLGAATLVAAGLSVYFALSDAGTPAPKRAALAPAGGGRGQLRPSPSLIGVSATGDGVAVLGRF
jgi:tetratricopeptide (TPR) repeat protein